MMSSQEPESQMRNMALLIDGRQRPGVVDWQHPGRNR